MFNGKTKWERGDIDWKERLKKIEAENAHVRVCRDDDIDADMLGSDLLVTDASSVGIEYMMLEKPVIFLPAKEAFLNTLDRLL